MNVHTAVVVAGSDQLYAGKIHGDVCALDANQSVIHRILVLQKTLIDTLHPLGNERITVRRQSDLE